MRSYFIRIVFAVCISVLVLSGCKSAPKAPSVAVTQKKVAEIPKELTPQEKALAQEKLLKEAKGEFDKLCAIADKLIVEKKFADAAETLRSYPEKFAQTEFKQKIAEKITQIEKLKKEEEERIFNEEAQSIAQQSIKNADSLVAEKRFAEALDLLNAYPKKYEQTPSWKLVKEKTAEVERLRKEEEIRQKLIREAQEEFKKRTEEAEALAARNEFDSALTLLAGFPQKFSQTEWQEKIQKIEADIFKRKVAYEEHQQLLREAKETADKTIAAAGVLAEQKNFDEAITALTNYPQRFAGTEHAEEITKEIEAVKTQKEAYEAFLAAAKEQCNDRKEKAKDLMKDNRYEDALKVLSEYPPEYSNTEWASEVEKFSRQTVQPAKEGYEAHQKFLREAQGEYESTMKDADALTKANKFDEAVSTLTNFPKKYEPVYGAKIEPKIKEVLAKKEEYHRKKIMLLVGGVIVGLVILLSVIVILVRRTPATQEQ